MENAPKSALIVDDSQTARHMLGKVLEHHHVRVEMAASAEEALDHLANDRPDVIFMDHLMPGMDGFQAVRAIKNNPATATIPIMMYTSQAGELYVGQARALGAVGVLPKQIRPVQVADTLKSLNLIPLPEETGQDVEAEKSGEVIPEADVNQTLAEVERMMEPADWGELHRWFEEMLRHHQDALRSDIESSVSRLLRESTHESDEDIPGLQAVGGSRKPTRLSGFNATTLLVLALSVFAAIFFWLYLNTHEAWQTVYEQNLQLLDTIEQERAASLAGMTADAASNDGQFGDDLGALYRELEWQINGEANYGPDEIPFGDERLEVIDRLVAELRALGFAGVVQLDSHIGDFCYVQAGDGSWEIGTGERAVSRCDRIGLGTENALAQSAKQSVAFANYVAATEDLESGRIRIFVNPLGNTRPVVAYPDPNAASTAGEWNRIARLNNFVRVRLIADQIAGRQSQASF